jgi:hypothetical protein
MGRYGSIKCSICNKPLTLETTKTDDAGRPVHEDCYASFVVSDSTNILDYPATLSAFEKESRWAEAKLAALKAKKSPPSA